MNFKNKFSLVLFSPNKTFTISIICALTLLLVQMYLNTGTLSGYAVTLKKPAIAEGYIVNYDYVHYQCNYNFIMGESVDKWNMGWVLRRELFFVISFPFFKLFGFYVGGILSAFIITLVSFYFFIQFIYKNMGLQSAYIAMALLATYPGIMYWIGSPFSQVMIVPCCCWIYALMWNMGQTDSFKKHVIYLMIIAVFFTAYDLFIFFYPAILLIYLWHKQWKKIIVSFPIMFIPQILIVLWLRCYGLTELKSENSGLYFDIISSYFKVEDFSNWFIIMAEAPGYLLSNYLDSNFLFLPLLFSFFVIWGLFKNIKLNEIEKSVLLSALLVFLTTNLAPFQFADVQLRGDWIARIYQPIFIVMLIYIIRFSSQVAKNNLIHGRYCITLIALCVCLNMTINIGGVFGSKLTQRAWYRFYMHSPQNTMTENLKTYGVRLIDFQDKKNEEENTH